MEPDRYQVDKKLYIICMVSLLVSLSILLFSLYILPHLLFGWVYDVPDFIAVWRQYMIDNFGRSYRGASFYIFLFFLVLGLLLGFVSSAISNQIDNQIHVPLKDTDAELKPETEVKSSSMSFFLKMLALLAFVYFSILIIEWLMVLTIPTYRGTL